MSVAVCSQPPIMKFELPSWLAPAPDPPASAAAEPADRPGQFDIWNTIQSEKDTSPTVLPPPYVHPSLRRSSSLLSQKSLEICTESLGSETGSEFSSDNDSGYYYSSSFSDSESEETDSETVLYEPKSFVNSNTPKRLAHREKKNGKQFVEVNYHCSGGGGGGGRTFPPPLPSISRRDGRPCVRMRPHRRDGRLVMEAVPVPSNTYLHAHRQAGRLRLSFIDCSSKSTITNTETPKAQDQNQEELPITEAEREQELKECQKDELFVQEEEELEELEEEEEVEVVDRGIVVEVKVSTHGSSLVINKFLGNTPQNTEIATEPTNVSALAPSPAPRPGTPPRRAVAAATAATTAAAAVVVAASSPGAADVAYGPYDTKLFFTSKRRDRGALLRSMQRCCQLRRTMFILEPYCIATS